MWPCAARPREHLGVLCKKKSPPGPSPGVAQGHVAPQAPTRGAGGRPQCHRGALVRNQRSASFAPAGSGWRGGDGTQGAGGGLGDLSV